MKVLQVLDCFYPNIDGPINVMVNIAQIANNQQLANVEILVPKYPKKYDIQGVKIHRCKSIKSTEGYRMCLPWFDRKIKKLVKNGGFDVIHIHSPFILGKYVIKLAKKYKIPVCITVHTNYKSDFERKTKCKLVRKFLMNYILKPINKCDYVMSVSNGAGQMVKDFGCTHEKIHIIRNGTDMKPIQNQQLCAEVKQKYNLENKFVFLSVGRIVENKNNQFSLRVLQKIKQQTNNFVFLIVGDGPYLETLKQLTKQYDLQDNVIFTGKIMDRQYLSAIYACSDLFMFPSEIDTCGIVALEAAVNRLPSVMLENTCPSELIVSEKNGLSIAKDEQIWATEIQKIMSDTNALEQMKKEVSETLYIPWEKIVREYVDFYEMMKKNNS